MGYGLKELNQWLSDQGLRHSRSREQVARIFFSLSEHVSVDELFQRVRKEDPRVGIATVYRTLNVLVKSGLALRRNFDSSLVTYERVPKRHHDHLICTSCGKIVEFHKGEIESLQEQVASRYGFVLQTHKMELYGWCLECRVSKKRKK